MNDKDDLRARIKAAREAAPPSSRAQWSEQACGHLGQVWPELAPRGTAALFAPFGAEADPSALAEDLAETAFPRVEPPDLRFAWCARGDLEPGRIREPPAWAPTADWSELDLVVVPGLAFDEAGFRVGYGRAYYDRTLAQARRRNPKIRCVGFAFALQVVARVPTEAHDQRLDGLVTEAGLRWFV